MNTLSQWQFSRFPRSWTGKMLFHLFSRPIQNLALCDWIEDSIEFGLLVICVSVQFFIFLLKLNNTKFKEFNFIANRKYIFYNKPCWRFRFSWNYLNYIRCIITNLIQVNFVMKKCQSINLKSDIQFSREIYIHIAANNTNDINCSISNAHTHHFFSS